MMRVFDLTPLLRAVPWQSDQPADVRDPVVQRRADPDLPVHLLPGAGQSAERAREYQRQERARLLVELANDADPTLFERKLREWLADDAHVLTALPTRVRCRAEVLLWKKVTR